MNRLQITLTFLIAWVFVASVEPAFAQRVVPPRPTLSPYFDLFRRDQGPLGGYHGYYRPRQRTRRAIQQQGVGLRQQRSQIRALNQRMSLAEGPQEGVRPTGTGSVFMNYSHYYNLRGSGGYSGSGRSWSPHTSRSQRFVGAGSSGHLGLGL